VALNRVGDSKEIASFIVFLASDAASYFTGSQVEISGGKYCVQNPREIWNVIDPNISRQ